MTHQSIPELRERARHAPERSLEPAAPSPGDPPDPEQLAGLQAALRSLPVRRREIFLAVRFDAMSYADIARRTGLSKKRVEREFVRALLALHRAAQDRRRDPWWRRFLRR